MEAVDELIQALRAASWEAREDIKARLSALATGPDGKAVRDHLESAKRGEILEIQWEIEEVLEAATPRKAEPVKKTEAPPPPAPEPPPDPNRQLSAKDLNLVYDDPRGLMLHKSKVGDRWFATQFDPRTGQPQTFELHPQEIQQLKTQLAGSPYWVIGAGGVSAAPAPAPKGPPRPTGPR